MGLEKQFSVTLRVAVLHRFYCTHFSILRHFPRMIPVKTYMSRLISHIICLFVCFVALRPKSTAMVMAGRSVHLTTLFFLGKLEQAGNQYFVHILSLVTDNNPS